MGNKNKVLQALLNLINRIRVILKEDTLEIYEKYLKRKKQKPPRKRINFWVGTILIVASSLGIYIVLPLFAGMSDIIFGEPAGDVVSPSSEALFSLILISTALGTLMTWFIRASSENEENASYRMLKFTGKCFLFAALSLALFMLLSPIIPTIRESTDLYEMTIKTFTMLSFLGGCITFIMADLIALLYIWKL